MTIDGGITMEKNLIRVNKIDETNSPFARSTYYKWFHLKKYPEIFRKFGGSLFVDLEKLEKLIQNSSLAGKN
jgi:hypothetical protein